MRRLAYGIAVGSLLWFSSCADEDPDLNCSQVNYRTCDIRQDACQRLVFDQMKCLRGYDGDTKMPPVFVVTDDEVRAEFEAAAEGAEPEPDLDAIYAALALLGLIDAGLSQEEAQVDIPLDGLLGFYSHESKQIVVVDSGEPLDTEQAITTLGHEYVHALQDQDFDLSEFVADTSVSFDASLAATSVIEGEAVLYDGFQLARIQGADPWIQDWPDYYENHTDYADEFVQGDPSPMLSARSIFPYTYGPHTAALAFQEAEVEGLVTSRGSDLFTQGFLARRHGAEVGTAADPDPLVIEAMEGRRSLGQEVLGAWLLNAFAQRVAPAPTPTPALALGWRGDVLSLFVNEMTQASELIWKVRFRDAASAEAFSAAVAGFAPPVAGVWSAFSDGDLGVIVATTDATSDLSELLTAAGQATPTATANPAAADAVDPAAVDPAAVDPVALSRVLQGLRGGCTQAPKLRLQ